MAAADMIAAERAAVEDYQNRQDSRYGGRRVTVLGMDVTPHIGYKVPGLTGVGAISNPEKMLKDPVPGAIYLWRKPDDGYTRWMVDSQFAKPVVAARVDKTSPYASISFVKVITREGPMSVIRTPGGLGLFEIANPQALTDQQKAHLPGEHWEHQYLSDLAGQVEEFEGDMDALSRRGSGRVVPGDRNSRGRGITEEDRQVEPAVGYSA